MADLDSYTGPERRAVRRDTAGDHLLNGFFRLLRWIGRHVKGFYAVLGVYFALGLGLAVGAIAVLGQLAEAVAEGETQRLDDAVLLWIDQHATAELTVVALEITALGSGAAVWMVVAVASLFLWLSRHKYSVLLLWVAMLGVGLVNSSLKMAFDRPRPQLFEWRQAYAGLSSFPSGHAATSMVVYTTLAYLVVRLEKSRLVRRLTLLVAAVVIVLIGLSRLYLGVHYPSDVLAGYMVGFAWATFCAMGIEVVRYFRARKPEVAAAEEGLEEGAAPIVEAVTRAEKADERTVY